MVGDYKIDYLKYLMSSLRALDYMVDTEVEIGLNFRIDEMKDDKFPYIQVQVLRDGDMGFGDTLGFLDNEMSISVQGFLRRENDRVIDEDMFDIITKASLMRKAIYQVHQDTQDGLVTITNFEQLSGVTEATYDYETFEKTSAFIFDFTAKFYPYYKS